MGNIKYQSRGCFGKYHYSHLSEKETLMKKMRVKCIEKENLYLVKGKIAYMELEN